jgi:hypothetical protein
MKIILSALTLTLLLSFTAPAQILVYKAKINITQDGNGLTKRGPVTSYILVDPLVAGNLALLNYDAKARKFQVRNYNDFSFSRPTGTNGKLFTVYNQVSSDLDEAGYKKLDSTLFKGAIVRGVDIGDMAGTWSVAKTMQASMTSTFRDSSGNWIVQQGTGTITLDLSNTRLFTMAKYDLPTAVNMLRLQNFPDYTELP